MGKSPTVKSQREPEQGQFWLIVGIGMLLVIATTGLARVALGAVLPYMQEGLSLSYSQSGMLGTFMFLGYLLTVGLSGVVAVRWGAKVVLVAGGWLVAIGLFGLAGAPSFVWASLFMIITGAGSALVFTPLMSLTIGWFPDKRGAVLGLLLSGAGIGMLMSGVLVPLLIRQFPDLGWRAVWICFGIISLAVVLIAMFVLSNPQAAGHSAGQEQEKPKWLRNKPLMKIAWLYFAIGVAYLVPNLYQTGYMKAHGYSDATAGTAFAAAGICSIVGGPIWGIVSDRIGVNKALVIALACAAAGDIIPILLPNAVSFFISAAIWGSTLGGLIALIQVKASQQVSPKYVSVAIGFISVFYAVGQMLGPGAAGWLIERLGGFPAERTVLEQLCIC
ncbi:YbfB/YjiJ family MFS transporter [Paenibacillus profundus]|uniref:YbfB/YjiJ family MFS transporter n=1 Tax=Paenibacillus profundus TaxID=1173085 RepID=A0ABS8YIP4_9BACL|nr:YbfB/YjiJ family MFS transporter [Paenibacillus profundus]